MIRVASAVLLSLVVVLAAARPNLSGHWELDKAKSAFGSVQPPATYIEVIEHKGPSITIKATSVDAAKRTVTTNLKLVTDDKERYNDVNGNGLLTRSRWANDRLITTITGTRGGLVTEVRYLSKDHKTQTVETYLGVQPKGEPRTRIVMVLK